MRLKPLNSLDADERAAWKRLAMAAVEPNPFYEPEFVLASARAEGDDEIQLLYEERDGQWIGCLPVKRRRVAMFPVLLGWGSPYSYLGTPLAEREGLVDFAVSLVRTIEASEFGSFLLMRRASKGPVDTAIGQACRELGGLTAVFERVDGRAALVRRDQPDYLSGMKSRRRSELKRQRKKLEAELGAELQASERTDAPGAVDAFLELEASGWKGQSGTAMASSEGTAELFREVCSSFAAEGRLLLRALAGEERVAAMTCDIAAGDVLFGFKAAFDERLHRYSPGIQLQIDNFLAFHELREERMFDSCGEPDNEPMKALWPDRREVATVLLGPTGTIGRLSGRAFELATNARRRRSERREGG